MFKHWNSWINREHKNTFSRFDEASEVSKTVECLHSNFSQRAASTKPQSSPIAQAKKFQIHPKSWESNWHNNRLGSIRYRQKWSQFKMIFPLWLNIIFSWHTIGQSGLATNTRLDLLQQRIETKNVWPPSPTCSQISLAKAWQRHTDGCTCVFCSNK